jgi:DNA-binding CsgD family transcriptional regulator
VSGHCQGCGTELPPQTYTGRARKWCSESCRKRTLYGRACDVCGRRDNGSEGKRESYVCVDCQYEAEYGERNRRILAAWERGETGKQIAAREGMTEEAVLSWLDHHRRVNGEPIPRHSARRRSRWEAIKRLWNEGRTGPEIAAELGISEGNVWMTVRYMREAGIDVPPRYERKQAA